MAKARPIFIDSQTGEITRTSFRKLSKDQKIEMMRAWFSHRFEDPVHHMPYISAEGGYQYLAGGPYDAREELDDTFYDLVPEKWIEELVDDLESETTDWAGTASERESEDEERGSLIIGTSAELQFRSTVKAKLNALVTLIEEAPEYTALIGHNHPPEPITDIADEERNEVAASLDVIKTEIESSAPDTAKISVQSHVIEKFRARLRNYVDHKADIAVEEFAKQIGKDMGKIPRLVLLYLAAHDFLNSLLHWLYLVVQ